MKGNGIRVAPIVLLLSLTSCASPLHLYPGSRLPSSATARIEVYRSTLRLLPHPGDIGFAAIDGTKVSTARLGVVYVLPGRHVFIAYFGGDFISTGGGFSRQLTSTKCTMEFEAIAGKSYSYKGTEERGALVDKETDAEVASCLVSPI